MQYFGLNYGDLKVCSMEWKHSDYAVLKHQNAHRKKAQVNTRA